MRKLTRISQAQEIARAGAAPLIARRIAGRYLVESELGRGGMGAVYRCLDASTARYVALKELTCDTRSRGRLGALFEREYHTLAGLQHPRIIDVYDCGIDQGAPYYTMELLAGNDLYDLSPLRWLEALARALHDAGDCTALRLH